MAGRNDRAVLVRAQWVAQHSPAVLGLVHRTFGGFSRVGTEPFLNPTDFGWTALLEQHYPAIRAEAERVLRVRDALPNFQDIAPDQIELSADDQWKTFWFVGYDVWDDPNCLRCPVTAAVLRAIPGLTTGFFSILGPGKRLPPHVGPYRGVLRHHLALVVPEPREQCGIRVGDQTRHWIQGQSLVFDDTYEHEAWNDTDSERVVLFLDIKRPLRPPMNWINTGVIKAVSKSPFIKTARAARRPRAAVHPRLERHDRPSRTAVRNQRQPTASEPDRHLHSPASRPDPRPTLSAGPLPTSPAGESSGSDASPTTRSRGDTCL